MSEIKKKLLKFLIDLFFPQTKETIVDDPFFGTLHRPKSITQSDWKGWASRFIPNEERAVLWLPASEIEQLDWAHEKCLQLKSRWVDLHPQLVDVLYEYYLKAAFNPESPYDLPDRDRFEAIIYVSYLRVFRTDHEQKADFEVEFWSPICGLYSGCMRIQITDWTLGKVNLDSMVVNDPSVNCGSVQE